MKDMINCDMCGSEIKNGECSCGTWYSKEEMAENPIKLGLEKFHEMEQFILTGDMPHLGCAVIYFRGDYNDCVKIENFICKMKGRPFYGDS
jgi:hypothetical protein